MNTTPAFRRTRPAPSPAALAALSLRDAINLNVAAAQRKAAPFAASHAQSAWACDDAQDEADAAAWNADMEQLRWAEAGGYTAGLARPCARRPAYTATVDDGSNDIPF